MKSSGAFTGGNIFIHSEVLSPKRSSIASFAGELSVYATDKEAVSEIRTVTNDDKDHRGRKAYWNVEEAVKGIAADK